MKTLLIVEDEKMIRQGIRAMVQRSGVPVEIILECSNGEKAWDLLQEQDVDVVFTDIRMPKMGGIELVQKMQSLPHIPLTVAISGYDDFSYAVEMMRSGVKDYLLKPIDRSKFVSLMHQLQEDLDSDQEQLEKHRQAVRQQIRYMLLDKLLPGEEIAADPDSSEGQILYGTYRILVQSRSKDAENTETEEGMSAPEHVICLKQVGNVDVHIMADSADLMEERIPAKDLLCGVSAPHNGADQLRTAYREAMEMWYAAWMESSRCRKYDEDRLHVPDALRKEALRQIAADTELMRVQLIGTDRPEELRSAFHGLFYAGANRRLNQEEFCGSLTRFFDELVKTYRNALGDSDSESFSRIRSLRNIWEYPSLQAYQETFINVMLSLQEQIQASLILSGSEQKMRQAVEYIKTHYDEDLNMAVVSNELSMNYSQFSTSFKQYTGENFVGYLRNVRMEKARALLSDTDMYIHEIAQAVGYENDKHFMKVFRSACGVSPSEYRRNARLGE